MKLGVDASTVGILVNEPVKERVDGLVQVPRLRDGGRHWRAQRLDKLLPQCLLAGGCVLDDQRRVLDAQRLKDRHVVPRRHVDSGDARDVGNGGVAQDDEALLDALGLVYVHAHAETAHVDCRHAGAALDAEDVFEALGPDHRHEMMIELQSQNRVVDGVGFDDPRREPVHVAHGMRDADVA